MALKDDIMQKALRRSKPSPKTATTSKYSHFKLYEMPPIEMSSLAEELNTNRTQTEHKVDTNHAQSEHKLNTKPDTKWTQTEHSLQPIFDNRTQSGHETEHKIEHKVNTNRTQTRHRTFDDAQKFSFSSYVGLQRDLLLLFYSDCKISRSRETQELSVQHIADSLNIRLGSVKTSICRLEEKGAIKRTTFKNGRSGWSKYELQEHIYREIMHFETEHKLNTNRTQTRHKVDTKLNTELDTTPPSNSSFSENKTITTTSGSGFEPKLSDEWQAINIEPLNTIGFTKTHLAQIAHQNLLSPDVVQTSIDGYAFALVENNLLETLRTKNIDPINYFMGPLRKGQPYAPPSNYESPEARAFRLYVEREQELKNKKAAVENAAIELAFEKWLTTLSLEEKNSLLAPHTRQLTAEQPKLAELKHHFVREVWPQLRLGIVGATNETHSLSS